MSSGSDNNVNRGGRGSSRGGSRGGTSSTSTRGNNRGGRNWKAFYRPWGSNQNNYAPRERPVALSIPNNSAQQDQPSTSSGIRVAPVNGQPPVSFLLERTTEKYPAWKLYHSQEAYSDSSKTVLQIRAIEGHYRSNQNIYDINNIKKILWFPLYIQTLHEDSKFMSEWPSFKSDLHDNPEHTLACAGLAMHQIILEKQQRDLTILNMKRIKARIYGYGPIVNLQSLKVKIYGKMISIRGTIIRVGSSNITKTWMAFECGTCKTQQAIKQNDGIYTTPNSCRDGCRAKSNFTPILNSPYTRTEACQEIRLQESLLCDNYESGRVPRNIEIEISEDLVDTVCPGDEVTVTGILKVKPQDEFTRKDQANLYKIYISGVTILSNKNVINIRKIEYTKKDLDAIQLIKMEPSPFRLMVQSLCPLIYGHDIVKAGLILGLFGGTFHNDPARRRTETHVLVVGDPGVGKSQLLQACGNISPRGVFICGNSCTQAGLTVTVRHEKGVGNALEAGALVLADQGVCCIDEFDKMSSNQQSLLEVMEQQTVSVAKAGVVCNLAARTSILAAANPAGGHYDRSKTISENLKISTALLSRFDLVFIILDRPSEYNDNLLTKHIQSLHAKSKKIDSSSSEFHGNATLLELSGERFPLLDRLKLRPNEQIDLLPHVLMHKYITYARKNFNPVLSVEAALELKKFYIEMREIYQSGVDTIPVTIRQLEALVRLTQARARIDLSETATIEHARDIIEIFRQSLADIYNVNDSNDCYMQRNPAAAASGSVATQTNKFMKILAQESRNQNKTLFSSDELHSIAECHGYHVNYSIIIDKLNMQGFLLKKGSNLYKLMAD